MLVLAWPSALASGCWLKPLERPERLGLQEPRALTSRPLALPAERLLAWSGWPAALWGPASACQSVLALAYSWAPTSGHLARRRPIHSRHTAVVLISRLPGLPHSTTATASISSRYSGWARPATTTIVLAGGGVLPRY